jgi:hypothetical protein
LHTSFPLQRLGTFNISSFVLLTMTERQIALEWIARCLRIPRTMSETSFLICSFNFIVATPKQSQVFPQLSLGFLCFDCISPFLLLSKRTRPNKLCSNVDLHSESHTADRRLHPTFYVSLSPLPCLRLPLGLTPLSLTLNPSPHDLRWNVPGMRTPASSFGPFFNVSHTQTMATVH